MTMLAIAEGAQNAAWIALGGLIAVSTALLLFKQHLGDFIRAEVGVVKETKLKQPLIVAPAVEYVSSSDFRQLQERVERLGTDVQRQFGEMRHDLDEDRKRSVNSLFAAQRQFASDMAEALGEAKERIRAVEAVQESHTRTLDNIDTKITALLQRNPGRNNS